MFLWANHAGATVLHMPLQTTVSRLILTHDLSALQRGLNKLREIRVAFESFGELSKEVLIHWKKIYLKCIFNEQQLKVAYISVMILNPISTLFHMKQR